MKYLTTRENYVFVFTYIKREYLLFKNIDYQEENS